MAAPTEIAPVRRILSARGATDGERVRVPKTRSRLPAAGRAPSPVGVAAAVAAGFAAIVIAFAALATVAPVAPLAGNHLQLWLVASLFTLTQLAALHLQIGRETRSVSLTELPFVLGLLFMPVPAFVLARGIGGIATELFARRQYRHPTKLAFNT